MNRETNEARRIAVAVPATFSNLAWLPIVGLVAVAALVVWKHFEAQQAVSFVEEAVNTIWAEW